jgi:hypothetical protein
VRGPSSLGAAFWSRTLDGYGSAEGPPRQSELRDDGAAVVARRLAGAGSCPRMPPDGAPCWFVRSREGHAGVTPACEVKPS